VDQRRSHGGIYASAQRANRAGTLRLFANRIDHGSDEPGAVPVLLRAAHLENEIAQNFRAAFSVIHFRMEFEPVESLSNVFHGANRIVRSPGDSKTFRQSNHMISVAVPDFELAGTVRKKLGAILNVKLRGAIFATFGSFHFSPERMCQPMHAVTNSQHWNI
jgi:hypothetical protein